MAAELRDRPEVVHLLAALHAAGGTAKVDELFGRGSAPREIGALLAAAVGLIRQGGDSGSWDKRHRSGLYELSDRGTPLLTALATLETLGSETR